MKAWVGTDDSGRVNASTTVEEYSINMTEVEVDDDFDFAKQGDYRLVDGELVYDGAQTAAEEAARQEAEAEAERRAAIDAGAAEYFADGGRERMQAEIDAASGGADPQLRALATLQISTMSFDSTPSDEVVKFIDYWPEWKPDTAYKHNDPLTYDGKKWRVSRDLTSQAIYPPGTAESEYYPVEVAPDGIIIFHQPGGAYNQIMKGEKRHYPDVDGPVYEALENTTYSPDAYPQHWKLVGDADTE